MIPEIGQRFGPYEILGHLGLGGMGSVFRAWDGRLHREVALKLLHAEFQLAGARDRFLREARAASALNHPHICTVFDIGDQDGEPYLVMELLQGETVKTRVARGAVPVDELMQFAGEIASALGAAHRRGIVHRDIKPANIFLVDLPHGRRQAKVLDFGLAKFAEPGRHDVDDLTSTGLTVGTVAYMSPEQARGETLDARSDLFSLGATLYEMATRQTPFKGTTSAMVFVQLLERDPEPVRDWNESVTKELERVILRLLEKNPDDRFQTAEDLYAALVKIQRGSGGWKWRRGQRAVPLVRPPDPQARMKRPPKRNSEMRPAASFDATREISGDGVLPAGPSLAGLWKSSGAAVHPLEPQVASEPLRWMPGAAAGDTAAPRTGSSSGQVIAQTPASSRWKRPMWQGPAMQAARESSASGTAAAAEELDTAGVTVEAGWQEAEARSERDASPSVSGVAADLLEGGLRIETADDLPMGRLLRQRRSRRLRWMAAIALLLVVGEAAFLVSRRSRVRVVFGPEDALQVGVVRNETGEASLGDGTISEGLAIQLGQSPTLRVLSLTAYESALKQLGVEEGTANDPGLAWKVAQRLKTRGYLTGRVSGAGPYEIEIGLFETASNRKIVEFDEKITNLDEVAEGTGRIAQKLRATLGEDDGEIARANLSLRREASGNPEALHAFAQSETALARGRVMDAIDLCQRAVAMDGNFAQAQILLARLYRRQSAEVAAETAGREAKAAAADSSERVRMAAEYSYQMSTTADFGRALAMLRSYTAKYPHDAEGLGELSRLLRLAGHPADALQASRAAIEAAPFQVDGYNQAELALLSMDRYDAALQLESQSRREGLMHPGTSLLATYLSGSGTVEKPYREGQTSRITLTQFADYGSYLDNSGQLAAGSELWREAASHAGKVEGLDSTAAVLLGAGALNRALAGDCKPGLEMAREAGTHVAGKLALFDAGMAEAMCGDEVGAKGSIDALESRYPQSTAVAGYYLPDLRAAVLLRDGNASGALEALEVARPYDATSLTPYLRGLAHVALHDPKPAVVDFQIVLGHRGTAVVGLSIVYPMAEVGLARAYAQSGDKGNSATAYRLFLELWQNADAKEPLMVEARAKTR